MTQRDQLLSVSSRITGLNSVYPFTSPSSVDPEIARLFESKDYQGLTDYIHQQDNPRSSFVDMESLGVPYPIVTAIQEDINQSSCPSPIESTVPTQREELLSISSRLAVLESHDREVKKILEKLRGEYGSDKVISDEDALRYGIKPWQLTFDKINAPEGSIFVNPATAPVGAITTDSYTGKSVTVFEYSADDAIAAKIH